MAPTRLPAPLRIGPYTWTFVCDADEWKKEPKHEDANAICDTEKLRILIDPEALEHDPVRLRQFVMHEIMHACFSTSHGDIDVRDEDKAEESFITVTSPLLLHVMRDNPKFVAWLTS